ncbi:hypothetical protein GGE12_001274 [Rhizobium mongolense]|uniref:Uncharacterized protein n=1 Tax=Rhizobium mongolense TaxID=57676 RepID=A0A7W6RJA1_9HYPH|nr:hypothetical protein [Rhizobium mongolense]
MTMTSLRPRSENWFDQFNEYLFVLLSGSATINQRARQNDIQKCEIIGEI